MSSDQWLGLTIRDAARRVLEEAEGALHYREITDRILKGKLWEPGGPTPWETVSSALYVDIQKRGDASPFRKAGPGVFALADWVLTGEPSVFVEKPDGSKVTPIDKATSFPDAAEYVLRHHSGGKPLHYRELTKRILSLGLFQSQGKTPSATLRAHVAKEIQRQEQRGERPRFVRQEGGYIGLSDWARDDLAERIEQQNLRVRKKLHTRLLSMAPEAFEQLVSELLVKMGFEEVTVTNRSGDGGIDVRGTLVVADVIRTRLAVQVKRWKDNVHSPIVQQVRGSLGAHEQGLIITTGGFSSGARLEAERSDATPVALMNGEELVKLLMEYSIGVKRSRHELFELDEEENG